MNFRFSRRLLPSLLGLFFAASGFAQAPEPTYWQDVRPLFRKHCTVCHSAKNLRELDVSGGLALDSFEAIAKGGKHAIFEPGKADASLILQRVVTSDKAKRMPLDAQPLAKEQIALVKRWIDAGAKEGKRPEDEPDPIIAKKSGKTRRFDVLLSTAATAPAGTLAKTAGRIELKLKVGPLAPVAAVAFSPDGKLLAAGTYGQVTIWDLAKAQPIKVLTNVLGAVNDLKFSPDGALLAVAGGQPAGKGDLRLYDVGTWKLLAVMRGHDDVAFAVAFSPDGKQLASASFDKTVRIWKTTGAAHATFTDHSDFVYAVAFSPDGKAIVSASKDRTVKMIEVATGKSLYTLGGVDQDVLSVAFHPEGKQLVSAGFEPALQLWNPRTGEKIKTQAGHGVAVHELAYSKDGKRLLSAGGDRTARIWDGATAAPLRTLTVGSMVYAVAITSNNKLVATGSFDGFVRLWDEATGRQLVTLLALPADGDHADWLAQTPEGYVTLSPKLLGETRWSVAGQTVGGEPVLRILRQPEQIARALRGEAVAEVKFIK